MVAEAVCKRIKVTGGRANRIGPNVVISVDEARGGGQRPIRAEITALANDYLTVRKLDADGVKTGDAFNVAKPFLLRHVVGNYDWPDTLTTTNTNEVEVSLGTVEYDWRVTPLYRVGDQITVQRVAFSGVEVSTGVDLKWIEVASERTWAVVL